ncbi:unnamed protein product [Choristocarpus tenellus]
MTTSVFSLPQVYGRLLQVVYAKHIVFRGWLEVYQKASLLAMATLGHFFCQRCGLNLALTLTSTFYLVSLTTCLTIAQQNKFDATVFWEVCLLPWEISPPCRTSKKRSHIIML